MLIFVENDSIEDSEVDNRLEKKKKFANLVKGAKSAAGFSPFANFELEEMTLHKHGLAAEIFSKWRLPRSFFVENYYSGKRALQRLKLRCAEKRHVYLL